LDIIFDIDGTLFDISHRVHFALSQPKNWKRFYEEIKSDKPIKEMCELLVSTAKDKSNRIIFCTGREESYRSVTLKQIEGIFRNDFMPNNGVTLYMREKRDFRKDYEVKYDLYKKMMKDGFNPKLVFEDKATVVEMWNSIGVRCLRVL
jgi:FMN phosphatase YigB (HAD superfamily)